MGEGISSELNNFIAKQVSKKPRLIDLNVDVTLVLLTVTLVVFGLLMVYSSSWDYSLTDTKGETPTLYFNKQLLWLGLGLACAAFTTWLDYHYWEKLSLPAIGVAAAALVLLRMMGSINSTPVRALYESSIRPSELAKLVTIIYLSVWLIHRGERLNTWNLGLYPLIAILGVMSGLIFIQPDLSAAMTVILLGGLLFFLAGGDFKRISALLAGMIVIGGLFSAILPTGRERIDVYISGLQDIQNSTDQVYYSLGAFTKGGVFGVGIGKSDTKLINLPIPPTDSIFAVIGEETGVLGAIGVITLFVLFLWRTLVISKEAPDVLGRLMAAGIGIWIVLEAFMNMSAMLGLLPFMGNALPMISYGGSNMLVCLTGIGIILNIGRMAAKHKKERIQPYHAVVDVRGGHGRRRVPRFGYPANPKA